MSNSWVCIFLFSLCVSLVFITTAEENPRGQWTKERIREMLLKPDGKAVDFDALKEIIEFIAMLEANDTSSYLGPSNNAKCTSPFVHENIPESEASYALNQYLQIGRRPSTTSSLGISVACDLCASVIDVAGSILTAKPIWPLTISLLKGICKDILPFSDFFCDGVINNMIEVGGYVAPEMVKHPYTICGYALKGCGAPDYPRDLWVVSIPPRLPTPPPFEVPTEEKLTILYLTDLHIDMRYEPGTAAECRESMCCRADSTPKKTGGGEAGYWGDYHLCDQPLWAFEDTLRQINETHADEIDLVIVNGDLAPHDFWGLTPEANVDNYKIVSKKLDEKLPGKPVYYTFGNHDAHPFNSYSFPDDPEEFSIQWLFEGTSDVFTKWMDNETKAEAEKTLKKAGFYTTLLKPKLRLIALNNMYCYWMNFFVLGPADISDPYGQLEWAVDLLAKAEKDGEQVIIIGHVVPGDNDCVPAWSWNYYRIIDRFAHVIAAQFFGHVHKDFYVLYFDAETLTQPKHVQFVGPPATMFPLNNIGYRLYDFANYTLTNYRQYYVDIGEANASGNNKTMPWKFQYSAREEYSLSDMSASSWADLAKRMRANETLYNIYRGHWNVDINNVDVKCPFDCDTDSLCTIYQGLSHVTEEWCERFVPTKEPDVDEDPSKRKCSARFAKYPDDK